MQDPVDLGVSRHRHGGAQLIASEFGKDNPQLLGEFTNTIGAQKGPHRFGNATFGQLPFERVCRRLRGSSSEIVVHGN